MRKILLFVMVVMGLSLTTQLVSAATANIFDQNFDTNGGANRFWVTDNCVYFVSGQAVSGRSSYSDSTSWLNHAAQLYNGSVVRNGTITGPIAASQVSVFDNNRVNLGGSNIGGAHVFQFNSLSEAQNFGSFLTTVISAGVINPNCGLLYSYTVPGSNTTTFSIGGDCTYRANGNIVNGENDWLAAAAATYRGFDRVLSFGNVTGEVTRNVNAQPNGVVAFGGRNVGGNFRFRFDSQANGQPFADFLLNAITAGVIDAGFQC